MKMTMEPKQPFAPPKGPIASIHQVLSTALGKKPVPVKSDKPSPKHDPDKKIIIGDKLYILQNAKPLQRDAHTIQWQATMCECTSSSGMPSISMDTCTYHVSNHKQRKSKAHFALVDRGANGFVFGDNIRVIANTGCSVDITGLDDHQATNKMICMAGGVTETQAGPVIATMHPDAYHGCGRMILAPTQLEAFGIKVSDQHQAFGGLQCMVTLDGYVIPIAIRNSLPYISMQPYTNDEWNTLPHVILTSDLDWDPSKYDHDPLVDDEDWVNALQHLVINPHNDKFDQIGDYKLVHPDATP